jgi:predicted ArsR family transcriptional regulator
MEPAASPSLRESVLAFMTTNPTAWRIKALAAQLGVGVQRMGLELSQLSAEGKLVSCTVSAPGRRPEEEYRIAAIEQKLATHRFVVSRRGAGRPRGPRPAG